MVSLAGGMAIFSNAAAMAQCYGPQAALPDAALTKFNSAPSDILKLGNAQLIAEVRDLVASSPPALQTVIGLLNSASTAQASAIGTGLGEAAMICVRTDRPFATEIQNAIATISNADLTTAFSAILGDQPIGAVNAGGPAGGPAGIGPNGPIGTPGFFGTRPIFGDFGTRNNGVDYFTSQPPGDNLVNGGGPQVFNNPGPGSVSPTQ